jgi:hypothetical protein
MWFPEREFELSLPAPYGPFAGHLSIEALVELEENFTAVIDQFFCLVNSRPGTDCTRLIPAKLNA